MEQSQVALHTERLRIERMRLLNEARALVDDAGAHRRAMTSEEDAHYKRLIERADEIENEVRTFDQREERERTSAEWRVEFDRQTGMGGGERAARREADVIRGFLRGDPACAERDPDTGRPILRIPIGPVRREFDLRREGATVTEARALAWDTGNVGSLVPTGLARELYQVAQAEMAVWRGPSRKLQTNAGNPLDLPKLTAHQIGTQVAGQGTLIGGTDPTFDKVRFDAFKAGALVRVANEVVQDSGIDILNFLGIDLGRAVGRQAGSWFATGTGSGQPQGMMKGLESAGSITTGGSLIDPTYEKLIDTVYAVNDGYRNGGNAAWLMRDATVGVIRKIRDGAGGTTGAPLIVPSVTAGLGAGHPDQLLGYGLYTDPSVASLASNARVLGFGDWNAFWIRHTPEIVVERDDSVRFENDEVVIRAKWRVDSNLVDTDAMVSMVRNV